MDKKYYTIAEFAKKVGLNKATIYRRLEKDLSQYCKIANGQKLLSHKAFTLFDITELSRNNLHATVADNNLAKENDVSCAAQLAEKDAQIAKMHELLRATFSQLKEKDLQIARRDEQISELTKAFREAQALHAGTLQRELSDNSTANDEHRWWKFWHKKK